MTVPAPPALGVGSTVWIFDENRRRYAGPVKPGHLWPSGPPIWREHWRPTAIKGETRVSWILENGRKVGKRDLADGKVRGVLTSEADLDAACYVNEHAYEVSERVRRLVGGQKAAEMLRQIAALVGYDDGQGKEGVR